MNSSRYDAIREAAGNVEKRRGSERGRNLTRQSGSHDTAGVELSELNALFLNCTLKRSPAQSHTAGLMAVSEAIMSEQGVAVERARVVDHAIPPGVHEDMTKRGYDADEWPELYRRVMAADIVVIGTPIWLGDKSSVCTKLIERLYGMSAKLNDQGQYAYYGHVGGCIVTGNEDGAKHCAMNILYSLQHLGFVIPPQADAAWVGEAGPANDFTQRNVTFMTWNLLHLARLIRDAGGIPAHGNQRAEWDAGCRFDHPNPAGR